MRYGSTNFEGETYQLVDDATVDKKTSPEGKAYYVAPAIRDGNQYHAYFEIIHDDVSDTSHACDWHNATYVEAI